MQKQNAVDIGNVWLKISIYTHWKQTSNIWINYQSMYIFVREIVYQSQNMFIYIWWWTLFSYHSSQIGQ